jgi:hypothetical protein
MDFDGKGAFFFYIFSCREAKRGRLALKGLVQGVLQGPQNHYFSLIDTSLIEKVRFFPASS